MPMLTRGARPFAAWSIATNLPFSVGRRPVSASRTEPESADWRREPTPRAPARRLPAPSRLLPGVAGWFAQYCGDEFLTKLLHEIPGACQYLLPRRTGPGRLTVTGVAMPRRPRHLAGSVAPSAPAHA